MKKKSITDLLISIAAAELVGLVSGLLAGNIGAVYQTFFLPPLAPPGWVFPVAWILLYAMMGTAAWMIFSFPAPAARKKKALIFYAAQLAVNFSWSIVFFRFGMLWGALAVIILLDILVALTMVKFFHIRKTAAYLLIPYLLWILFATYLNGGIALLN